MSKRIEYLDSLRGLAAIQVVMDHCFIVFPILLTAYSNESAAKGVVWVLTYTPLHLLWDGVEAVTFFFVLSGFVLALPYFDSRAPFYPSYLVRRFFRIYIPYIVVVTISALLLMGSLPRGPMPGISDDFVPRWSHMVGPGEYLKLILMIGHPVNVDSPAWSLAWEMRISVFFPLICLIVGRLNGWMAFGFGLFLTIASPLAQNHFPYLHFLTSTTYYSSFFIFGCVLAKYRKEVGGFLEKLATWQRVFLVAVALGLYNIGWELWVLRYFSWGAKYGDILAETAPGLASVLIIGSALTFEKLKNLLRFKVFLWVGKVSYSLYLAHMVVLLSAIYFLPSAIPLLGRVILGAVFSFLVAGLSYQFLELPCINIGHFLAKKLDSKRRSETYKFLPVVQVPKEL